LHSGVVGSLGEAVTVTVTTDQSCGYFHGAEKQTASQISETTEKRKQTTNSSKLRRWLPSRDCAPDVEMSCDAQLFHITACSWGRYLKFHISSHLEANEIPYNTIFLKKYRENDRRRFGAECHPVAGHRALLQSDCRSYWY
jgi:hypothetical protein